MIAADWVALAMVALPGRGRGRVYRSRGWVQVVLSVYIDFLNDVKGVVQNHLRILGAVYVDMFSKLTIFYKFVGLLSSYCTREMGRNSLHERPHLESLSHSSLGECEHI